MRVTIDLMKKSTQIIDLSNVINPRVGDDDLQLPLHIGYGDNLFDMRGKDVEFLSNDPNKKNIYIAGTCNTNTPGDNLYMGDLTFRFPAGTFKADGTYDPDKTMFRIVDKETQKVISSVNVKITIMKNSIEFDFDPDKSSYDSRAETMLNDFKDKGQAMLDEIKDLKNQANSNVSGDTAAIAKEAKKQADQNAGDISDLKGEVAGARGRFANMAGREDAQDAAINQKESIANANANYTALQKKDAQQDTIIANKANQNFITDYLSKMSLQPEGFENEAALLSKYPNGQSGIMVTVDTGHGWIWSNVQNKWVDFGVYQGVGLPADEQKTIQNALHGDTIVYDDGIKPPYDDLDSLADNTIVTYAIDITRIRHSPNNLPSGSTEGATVITVNYGNNTDGAGRIQLLITDKADQFVRIKWGNPITWSEWKSSIFRSYPIVQDAKTAQKPFDDLNTLPANSIVIYATEISSLQDIPDESLLNYSGANVITISSHLGDWDVGSLQILLLNNGQLFHRMKWGTDSKYGDWSHPLTKYDFAGIMAFSKDLKENRYNDLDKLPVNTTVTYSLNDDECGSILHYPSKVPGTVRTISCGIGEMTGQFQILIDRTNQLYHRIMWGVPGTYGAWKSEGNLIKPSISLFQNIGIVGDSYASGELYVNGNYIDHYDISWGQILARKNGIKATNFSRGGLTTRSWLTDEHGLALLNNSDAQNLYIIALGINDFSLGDSYLGTENDVNTKADTFYGNYGKIIAAIQAKAPNAKIILSTMSYDGQGVQHNFNEAIKTIAKHYGLPVIVQVDDPLFTSEFYTSHMVGGHPTAPVYSAMANAFQRLIEQSMVDNLDYFMTYKQ